MGVEWAGYSDESPPVSLDAAIIFAPVGSLVPLALHAVRAGWARDLRRHSHERHPRFPVRNALARTHPDLCRQSYPEGREGIPCAPGKRGFA